MKKMYIIFLLSSYLASAQFSFGVNSGASFSTVETNLEQDPESMTSIFGSVFSEYRINRLSIGADISYNTLGYSWKAYDLENQSAQSYEVETTIEQLNLLVYAKYEAYDNLSLSFGPYIGTVLNSESEYQGDGLNSGKHKEDNIKGNTDFGLNAGISYVVWKGLFIKADYSLGLANLYDYEPSVFDGEFDPDILGDKPDLKNRFLKIGIGYNF